MSRTAPDCSFSTSSGGVRLGILGAGLRTRALLKLLLPEAGDAVRVELAFDPDPEAVRELNDLVGGTVRECRSEKEVIEASDWVFIGSYNSLHARQAISALRAGCHVFCEKPLATTVEDCLAVGEAVSASRRTFFFGLVLRYSPVCRKVQELVASGAVGEIVSLEFNETLHFNHGGFIFGNWRRSTQMAGSHVLEKCCHDLDLANWITGSLPVRAASFGSRRFFRPENRHHMARIGPDERGHDAYYGFIEPEFHSVDPFSEGADIMDNQVAILEFANGVRATFHANCNAGLPERRFYICGTEGALRADIYTGKVELARIGPHRKSEVWDMSSLGAHAGGDEVIMREFLRCMKNPTLSPIASVREGIESAVVALAIDKSAHTGNIVDLRETWQRAGYASEILTRRDHH